MPRDVTTAPLDSIDFSDIDGLLGTEEGLRIEFKEALSTSDGRLDRWMVDQKRIGNVARDDIAKEIVAFANAYGGILIIGIEETDDNPKRAKSIAKMQIPAVVDCADQLERALRAIIEPPLPMLEIRGIVSDNGHGVILARVGSSGSAPHGFGRPPDAYVRRGAVSEPLTMRDLQSIFFERRTRLERVRNRRDFFQSDGDQLRIAWTSKRLHTPYRNQIFPPTDRGIFFRCSAVSSEDFEIDNFPDHFLRIPDHLLPRPTILANGELIDLPRRTNEWRRRYRSVECVATSGDHRFWKAGIYADGTYNAVSISNFYQADSGLLYLHVYSAAILQTMIMAEWLRRWRSRPETDFILDAAFVCQGALQFNFLDGNYAAGMPIPWSLAHVGPYSVGKRDTFSSTFDSIERELWDLCGMQRQPDLKLKADVAGIFRSLGL